MCDFEASDIHFHVYCYTNVTGSDEINNYLKANQPPICLVDAKIIICIKQIQVAVLNAVALQKSEKMQSKNVYMEILRCLSPDGRLSGAFKYCAVGKSSTDVIAITLENEMPKIPNLTNPISFEDFNQKPKADLPLVRKIFQITDEMLQMYSYEEIVMTTLAVTASDLVHTKALQ